MYKSVVTIQPTVVFLTSAFVPLSFPFFPLSSCLKGNLFFVPKMPSTMSSAAGINDFETYFQRWMARQERFHDELVAARESLSESHDNDVRDLINRVEAHYQEYYEEKSRMTSRNVFLMFSPTWFTPLERSFLWVAGFKPGLACRVALSAVDDLTEDQTQEIDQLSIETKREEKALNDEVAKIQESLAAPPLVDFARSVGQNPQQIQREIEEVGTMIESLKAPMQNLLNNADRLRTRTAERILRILSPIQIVRFFAAVSELQMRLRMLGKQREDDRAHTDIRNGW